MKIVGLDKMDILAVNSEAELGRADGDSLLKIQGAKMPNGAVCLGLHARKIDPGAEIT